MNELEKREAPKVLIEELRGKSGFKLSERFVDKLRKKFPDRRYSDVFGHIGMSEEDFLDKHITRIAKVKRKVVGVLVGEDEGRAFSGTYLFVDPEFAALKVGEKLIHSVLADHDSFTLYPYSLSKAPGLKSGSSKLNRERALRAYYRRLGFEPISTDEMKWTRK